MYCRRCGKEIAADAAFCPYCGARQEDEPQQASSVPPYNGGSSVPPYTGQGSSAPPYSGQTQSQYLAGGYRAVPAELDLGIAGMIVGLVSLWLSWVLFLGLVASIVAIAISGVALSRRNSYRMNGFAVAGLVLGIVALLPSILYVVIFIVASLAATGGGMVL